MTPSPARTANPTTTVGACSSSPKVPATRSGLARPSSRPSTRSRCQVGAARRRRTRCPAATRAAPDEHVLGARGERLRAFLHPDGAQHARPRVDADREPAPHAELGVLVDPHDLLARPQPVEHAPLPQVAQVVGGALPAEDGEPAQLVDLPLVAVGAGVGEHPAGGVLDADDAVGEQRDRLGEGEQVVGPRGFARVEHSGGERLQALPAHVHRYGEQRDPRLHGGRPQRFPLVGVRGHRVAARLVPDGPPSVGLFGAPPPRPSPRPPPHRRRPPPARGARRRGRGRRRRGRGRRGARRARPRDRRWPGR